MNDPVNSPSHYVTPGYPEAIEIIEAAGAGYHVGNALKYLLRAGKKDDARQDIRKAEWYLLRHHMLPHVPNWVHESLTPVPFVGYLVRGIQPIPEIAALALKVLVGSPRSWEDLYADSMEALSVNDDE